MLDVKILPRGPLWCDKVVPDLGLPRALAGVQGHSASHGGMVDIGGGWCGLE
jgi:hypothetical protein